MDDESEINEPDEELESAEVDQGSGLVEYVTLSGEFWAVDRFSLLAAKFELGAGDLPQWHEKVAGQNRAWEVIRLLYGVSSLAEEVGEDFMRSWTLAELAKKYGVKVGQLEVELDKAVRVWKVSKVQSEVAHEAVGGLTKDEFEQLISFSRTDGLDPEMVDGLLRAFNFTDIKDELLRAEVAKRILSLREYLTGPHTRMAARQVIRMEVTMHSYELLQTRYQNDLDAALAEDPKLIAKKSEVQELEKKIQLLTEKMSKLGKEHKDLQKSIGADETDLTAKKVLLVDTIAYVMEKCREFESDPENWKPDGIFTAGQINWLMEPLGERAPQYRPDISVRLAEALAPENLWNPKYVPTPIQNKVVQKLRQLVEAVKDIREGDAVDREVDEDDFDEDSLPVMAAGSVASVTVGDAVSAPASPVFPGVRSSGGDEVMGVF